MQVTDEGSDASLRLQILVFYLVLDHTVESVAIVHAKQLKQPIRYLLECLERKVLVQARANDRRLKRLLGLLGQ